MRTAALSPLGGLESKVAGNNRSSRRGPKSISRPAGLLTYKRAESAANSVGSDL